MRIFLKPLLTLFLCIIALPAFLLAFAKEQRFAARMACLNSFYPLILTIKDIWKA